MRKTRSKLSLSHETIRRLQHRLLDQVGGGLPNLTYLPTQKVPQTTGCPGWPTVYPCTTLAVSCYPGCN